MYWLEKKFVNFFTTDNQKTVNYSGLIALLISAVNELNEKIQKSI